MIVGLNKKMIGYVLYGLWKCLNFLRNKILMRLLIDLCISYKKYIGV